METVDLLDRSSGFHGRYAGAAAMVHGVLKCLTKGVERGTRLRCADLFSIPELDWRCRACICGVRIR